MFMGVVQLKPIAAQQFASQPVSSVEELKGIFVVSFLNLDESTLIRSYENLVNLAPSDPETPVFAYEIARLFANAAALHFEMMHSESAQAEKIFREFLPEGKFGQSSQAPVALVAYAQYLLATGQEDQSRAIYRILSISPDLDAFASALTDVMNSTVMTKEDIIFWKQATEKRIATTSNTPIILKWRLATLNSMEKGKETLKSSYRQAMVRATHAEHLLNSGETQKAIDELRQVKSLLDYYFNKLPAAAESRLRQPRTLRPKLILAEAELWLGNGQRSLNMLDEVIEQIGMVEPGERSRYFGQAHYWRIMAEGTVLGLEDDAKEQQFRDLLETGHCTPKRVCDIAEQLAIIQESKGNVNDAYSYYNDLIKVLPNPALALWARRQQEKIEHDFPFLKHSIKDKQSSLFSHLFSGYSEKSAIKLQNLEKRGKAIGPYRFPNWKMPHYDPLVQSDGEGA